MEFIIDPNRCIGCGACVQACSECDSHKDRSMIHMDYIDRARSTQTAPSVCMHCERPTCAEVCPADAIKRSDEGVVFSALKSRCIACNNCVLACPFGIPKMITESRLMMKCDMCYDRTSIGKKPMCATVCPSGALWFGAHTQLSQIRPGSQSLNAFQFGNQLITTKVNFIKPVTSQIDYVDVTANINKDISDNKILINLLNGDIDYEF